MVPKVQSHAATIEEVSWDESRSYFEKVKPDLAQIIDEWKPSKKLVLLKARYPYGSLILKNGILQLPNKTGNIVPINHGEINPHVANLLSYSSFPLGLITKNGTEVYLEMEDRIFSLRLFLPGTILGLWESLEPPKSHFPMQVWTVTAGARNLFSLPKIKDAALYTKLRKEFGLSATIPKDILTQWSMYRKIANHENFPDPWYCEVFFFTKPWLEERPHDLNWVLFHRFLLNEAWRLSQYGRNTISRDVVWEFFARTLDNKGFKPNPYHMDTLKHIIGIALGAIPGMRAAGNYELSGPVKSFQRIILESYGLKTYVPTFIHPYHLDLNDPAPSPVYYSLQVPNLLQSLPKFKNLSSALMELNNLQELIEHFFEEAQAGHLKVDTAISELANTVKFDYFHSEPSRKHNILHTSEMPKGDPNLIYLDKKYGQRKFAETAHFIRGCIRISKK